MNSSDPAPVPNRGWITVSIMLATFMQGVDTTIAIDAYPGVLFDAKVQSLSPGTGLTFSLLPAENATGNWVKVVQRLTVRLDFDQPPPDTVSHSGLSATVEVDTGYRRPSLDRFDGMLAWLTGGEAHRAAQR